MRTLSVVVLAVSVVMTGCSGAASRDSASIPAGFPTGIECQWAKVTSITDGDTVRVDFEGGPQHVAVRYIGMDTPETLHSTAGEQPFGPEASNRNKQLVLGKRVCLERDVSETDRYGRLLRYAWLSDGRIVNELLVEEGLAVVDTFPPDVKYLERFRAAQAQARDKKRGLWGE